MQLKPDIDIPEDARFTIAHDGVLNSPIVHIGQPLYGSSSAASCHITLPYFAQSRTGL